MGAGEISVVEHSHPLWSLIQKWCEEVI